MWTVALSRQEGLYQIMMCSKGCINCFSNARLLVATLCAVLTFSMLQHKHLWTFHFPLDWLPFSFYLVLLCCFALCCNTHTACPRHNVIYVNIYTLFVYYIYIYTLNVFMYGHPPCNICKHIYIICILYIHIYMKCIHVRTIVPSQSAEISCHNL